jgi:hypothetical protein
VHSGTSASASPSTVGGVEALQEYGEWLVIVGGFG